MSSMIGDIIKLSLFGESHGECIGVVVDGLPAGVKLDTKKIKEHMYRRNPTHPTLYTARREDDIPKIMSGVFNGYTTGTPLCALIYNHNTASKVYEQMKYTPRPSHADYVATAKYKGFSDYRGGGHFSARLTAPLVFAGAILRQILEEKNIFITSHLYFVKDICDDEFNPLHIDMDLVKSLGKETLPLINKEKEEEIIKAVTKASEEKDSLGGVVQCAVVGLPMGVGAPLFDSLEGTIAKIMFSIPAVKGVEFGNGFACTKLYGSENNDQMHYDEQGNVSFSTNNSGGIQGGISNGMPIIFNVAFKPTPSIAKPQCTVNLEKKRTEKITVKGRYDPCAVLRAPEIVEATCAIVLADELAKEGKL